jgi:hypothetical protein
MCLCSLTIYLPTHPHTIKNTICLCVNGMRVSRFIWAFAIEAVFGIFGTAVEI